jgi:hypothetical protein
MVFREGREVEDMRGGAPQPAADALSASCFQLVAEAGPGVWRGRGRPPHGVDAMNPLRN